MDNSMPVEILLRCAYYLLLEEHEIVSTEVGEILVHGDGTRPYHRDECGVCDCLADIDTRLGISVESFARNVATDSGAQKGWRERPVTVIRSTAEDEDG